MAALKAGIALPPSAYPRRDLDVMQEFDRAGVDTVWQTASGTRPDSLSLMAAAAATTETLRFGTSIVPTYTRHPTVMANQAAVVNSLAPGRLRLGIGPSHRPVIEDRLGLPMGKPLSHLREYVTVLRSLLTTGGADFHGEYFDVSLPPSPDHQPIDIEVMISALGINAFRAAGEIADGAISWVAPVRYLLDTALPALQKAASEANRRTPPIIAHVPVAVTTDRKRALGASASQFGMYGSLPFYARMFDAAGVPVGSDNRTSPEAIDALTVSGSSNDIRDQLQQILDGGIGELLISHVVVDNETSERQELSAILGG